MENKRFKPDYLIVAQPKAASTSLMKSLGEIGKVSYAQQMTVIPEKKTVYDKIVVRLARYLSLGEVCRKHVLSDEYPALDYPALRLAHSDIADFGVDHGTQMQVVFSSCLHKQHFPPTNGNIKLFEDIPKIILIRDPEESVESYLRVPYETIFRRLLESDKGFRKKVLDDLSRWRDGWLTQNVVNNVLIIEYADLVKNQDEVIRRCAMHFGFISFSDPDREFVLEKERVYRPLS